MTQQELDLMRKKLATTDSAAALSNSACASTLFAYDEARNLIFANPHGLSPQEALDALWAEDKFAPLYAQLSAYLGLLLTLFPDLTIQFSPVEIVTFLEDGKLGGIVTEMPFDIERERYPHQPSRAAAEAFAAALVEAPTEGDEPTE